LINSTASGDVQLFASQVNNMLCEVSRDLKPLPSNQSSDGNLNTSQHYSRYVINLFEVFHELTRIDLPNWVLHEYAFAISEPLCHIFNYSLQNGVVPDIWKAANVVPIPKRQPPTSIYDDLRPISLTPTLSKILERLIGRRMLPSIIPKFDHRQYGALKGRSTNHALIDVIHMCHQAVDQHQSARCLFIDFSKAFDHVDHETVLNKLSEWGTDVIFLRWMRSYLYNRRQRVKIGNAVSAWSRPNGGMPQGSFFGPYVFLILINDLVANVPLIKFVDDITAVEIVNHGAGSQMQTVLDQIAGWCSTNFMVINPKKSKEMLFGSLQNDQPALLAAGTSTIERVRSFKLLGVNISDNLRWDEHVNSICSKAGKRLHYLSLLKRSSVSDEELLHFFKSVVRPVLEYACPVWQSSLTTEQRDRIETIQRRALRIISGSNDYEFQCAVHNIELLSTRLQSLSKSFYERICRPDDCLHFLLPPCRPTGITDKFRHCYKLPLIKCRTERYRLSFLPYSLAHYQDLS
jgi:hypothetical protein